MKKNGFILIIILFAVVLGVFGLFFFYTNNSKTNNQSQDSKNENYTSQKTAVNSPENQNNTSSDSSNTTQKIKVPQFTETTLSSFSTKIYSSDSARQNNINITCNTLNETRIKNGETFSFCDTVGMATTAKVYQEADIFDKYGNKKKGLRWW